MSRPATDSANGTAVYVVCAVVGAGAAYAVFSSQGALAAFQIFSLFLSLLISAGAYFFLGKGPFKGGTAATLAVFGVYCAITAAVFYPTAGNIFRSDDWLLLALFDSVSGFSADTLKKISFFEMFGHVRFQPLAHLLIYARHLVFGASVTPYHLLNMGLHALTAFLVYRAVALFTEDLRLSFLLGLVFITLPSQFDTVNWTYHIYIIAGTILALLAVILAAKGAAHDRRSAFALAVFLALVSFILYESAAFAPAALLFTAWASRAQGPESAHRRPFLSAIVMVALAYVFYAAVAAYGVSLTKAKQAMSLADLFHPENILASLKTFFLNLWESSFLKNTGAGFSVTIGDIVYARLSKAWYADIPSLIKAGAGLFVLMSLRPVKGKRLVIAAALALLALSYVFIIALGRSLTNEPEYFIAQPRYQYFANAFLLAAIGLFLCASHKTGRLRHALAAVLIAISFWNTQTVMAANNRVAEAMRPMDAHYYRIKAFLTENPSAKLFLDFTPETSIEIFLGTDTALDLLFRGRITKFQSKATHLYDGAAVRPNFSYAGGGEAGGPLKDFTVMWNYMYNKEYTLNRDVAVVGSLGRAYPVVAMVPGFGVAAALVNAQSGAVEAYRFAYQKPPAYSAEAANEWQTHAMLIEKDGDTLCFGQNGRLAAKARLNSPAYGNWTTDGFGLFGDYYKGSGAAVYVSGLYILADGAVFACKDAPIGAPLMQKGGY